MMAIEAVFRGNNTTAYTKNVYQHDKGQMLVISGIDLPEEYEVHFSNTKDFGLSVACKGTSEGVLIPNAFFVNGDYVYAFINSGVSDGTDSKTLYMVTIPVIKRPVSVPVQSSSSGSGIKYEIDEDEENLIITDGFDGTVRASMEDD